MDDITPGARRGTPALAAGLIGGIFGSLITVVVCFALFPSQQASGSPAPTPAVAPTAASDPLSGMDVIATFPRCPDNLKMGPVVTVATEPNNVPQEMVLCQIP